jgi:DNA-binding CsgD family transcriptional regulator
MQCGIKRLKTIDHDLLESALADNLHSLESNDPRDKRFIELLHNRVKNRAISLRWNLNGLMFIYAILIIVLFLAIENANGMFVALIAVIGLLLIWLYSSLRVRKLERQFYQQEIHDYAESLKRESYNNFRREYLISESSTASPLTRRELEILTLISNGKRNKEIAYTLGISEATVKNHMSHVFSKLEIYDRVAVVLLAIRSGWIKYDISKKFDPKSTNI